MLKIGDNWKCPYCGHAQVVSRDRCERFSRQLYVEGWKTGIPGLGVEAIVCANDQCRELSLWATLANVIRVTDGRIIEANEVQTWTLLPPSSAKPQPDYIPEPLRQDYYEACAIRDLSPKASATITRRCLQGMIRHFCGISGRTLFDEINELRTRVHDGNGPVGVLPDSVDAIDHVREIGNIGAHMQADINVIVDVDSDEAQILIDLVELLFEEWYVARQTRTQGLAKIKTLAADKKQQKQPPKPTPEKSDPN
jgi:hypothetical protein